jgi:hypothetical protein
VYVRLRGMSTFVIRHFANTGDVKVMDVVEIGGTTTGTDASAGLLVLGID